MFNEIKSAVNGLREKFGDTTLKAAVGLVAAAPVLASAQGISAEITAAETEILGYVASWGAAFIAVALAGVGWRVGAKLIKRMAGAA